MLDGVNDIEMAGVEITSPSLLDLVYRMRVEKVSAFSSPADDDDEVGVDEDVEMLSQRLTCHRRSLTQLPQGLTVLEPQ